MITDQPATGRTARRTPLALRWPGVRSIPWIGLTLLLLALIVALPVWTGPGLVNTRGGGDSPFLFFRLQQLVTNLRDGVFPARWMPDAAYGLGYPFFNYYAALPYYVGALFNLIGFDLLVSIKLAQTLGCVFAAAAMYRWAARHVPTRSAAWLIAVAYTFAPFHLVNVYVRGDSLGEFYAFAFYPLILLAIDRVLEAPRAFGWLALSYGGLIVTHNVSALIFSPFVLAYCVVRGACSVSTTHHAPRTTLFALALGFSLALALSAWFWLPALGEANLVQLDHQTTGYFNYAEHFRAGNLIQGSIGFDYSIAADARSSTPFAMGLAQAIGAGLGLAALIGTWRRSSDKCFRAFVVGGLIVSTLMITPLSKVVWDNLPLLPLAQFPWRFLSVQALFASLAIGYLIPPLRATHHAPRTILFSGFIGLAMAASTLLTLTPDYLPIRADEITPARLQLYEAFTGNIGTTIRAEYLPRTTVPRPYTGPGLIEPAGAPRAIVSSGEAAARQLERHAARQVWAVTVESERATLSMPLLYWPGWAAAIDGQPVEVRAAPDLGYVQIDVPQGEHQITFELGRTPLRLAGESISLLAGVGLLLAGVLRDRQRRFRLTKLLLSMRHGSVTGALHRMCSERARNLSRGRLLTRQCQRFLAPLGMTRRRLRSSLTKQLVSALLLVIGLGLAAFIYQFTYAVPDNAHDLTMDFADKPWLHHNPGGVDFGTARLIAYDVTVGERIKVNTDWQVTASSTVTIALVAPSTHLVGGPGPIVEQTQSIATGLTTYNLMPPYALPTGLYYLRVRSATHEEYLTPIWIQHEEPVTAAPAFGKLTASVGLAAVQAQHVDPNQLNVRLTWTVNGAMDANYGISLRLRDIRGKVWTSLDTQPGYGFQPTSAWPPGTFDDAYTLNLPADLPREFTTQPSLRGTKQSHPIVPEIASFLLRNLPVGVIPNGVRNLWPDQPRRPSGPEIPRRKSMLLRNDTALTSFCPHASRGRDGHLAMTQTEQLPRDGVYRLDVILYRVASQAEAGRTTIEGLRLDEIYAWRSVEPPARNFSVPPLAHPLAVTFGDQIRLMGCDVARDDRALTLNIAWQAVRDIDQNYRVFVHVFDPATETIVAQSDVMPRDNAYPTSRWIGGEVVTDTITLSLADVPPGSYRIAIGLFDAAGRLPVSGSGAEVANERVVLDEVIEVRYDEG